MKWGLPVIVIGGVIALGKGGGWFESLSCHWDTSCRYLVAESVNEICGTPNPPLKSAPSSWGHGWRKMAAGLSMLGQDPGRTLYDLVFNSNDTYVPWDSKYLSYFIVQYPFVLITLGFFFFTIFVLPFLLAFRGCCGACKRYAKQRHNSIFAGFNLAQLIALGIGALFALWVLIVGWVEVGRAEKRYDDTMCTYMDAHQKLLYSGVGRWESVDQLMSRLTDAGKHIRAVDAKGLSGRAYLENRFNSNFREVFFTEGYLKDTPYAGWGEKTDDPFKLEMSLAILDEGSSVLADFEASFRPFVSIMQAVAESNSLGDSEIIEFLNELQAIREQVTSSQNELDRSTDSITNELIKPQKGDYVELAALVNILGFAVFTLLLLLTGGILLVRVLGSGRRGVRLDRNGEPRHDTQPSKTLRVLAGVLCWFWSFFIIVFSIIGIAWVTFGAAGSAVCDSIQDYGLTKKGGGFKEGVPAIFYDHCLADTADGKVIMPLLTNAGADLEYLENLKVPENVEAALEEIQGPDMTPMFKNGWGEWTETERSMVLPAAGTSTLAQLKSIIGPELAVASLERYDCSATSPVCKIASERAGVALEYIRGLSDIEAELTSLFDSTPYSLSFPGTLNMKNTRPAFPSMDSISTGRTTTATTKALERLLKSQLDVQKMYALIWQGVRLSAVKLNLARAPHALPEGIVTSPTAPFIESYSEICPPSYECPVFLSGSFELVPYNQWASTFWRTFEESGRSLTSFHTLVDGMRLNLGRHTSANSYATFVRRLDSELNCLDVVQMAQDAIDTVCDGGMGTLSAIGFQFWGATILGIASVVCLFKLAITRSGLEDDEEDEEMQRRPSGLSSIEN